MVLRSYVWAACLAFGFLSVGAQAQVTGPVITSPNDIDIGPDQELIVREYIIRRRPAPVDIESTVIRPGSIIPSYVELEPLDGALMPSLRGYAYFVSPNNKIVVVDPRDRQVVRILDL